MKRLLLLAVIALFATQPTFAQRPNPSLGWDVLKAAYAYDSAKPLDAKEQPEEIDHDAIRVRMTFTDLRGESVPGILLKPTGKGPFPCLVLLHGLGGNKEQLLELVGPELTKKGFAVFAIDAKLHGARKQEGEDPKQPLKLVALIPDTVRDWRQALDWLSKRPDIQPGRIGLMGYSMGAIMGSILAGVDSRVQASCLCVGGDPIKPMLGLVPANVRSLGELASPSNYIGHAAPRPVYLVNGTKDTTITPEAARRLIAAAKQPRVSVWVESGHLLPADAVRKGIDWVTNRLRLPAGAERYADPGALAKPELLPVEDADCRVEKLTFTNATKESVSGLYVRPKTGEGPFPLVLVLHGRGHSKERMLNTMKREFAQRGVAALALDAAFHGDRAPKEAKTPDPELLFTATIQDYRQVLHWALERPELDPNRVGVLGFSMGAMMGTILTGLDLRIQAATLCVGGELETLPELARPAAYAPFIADRPVCFVNGHKDPVVPEAAALKLHAAAKDPKTVIWYDEPDHTLPKPTLRQGTDWLIARLKTGP